MDLARLGQGAVAPNPMVGCVIVHEGVIIGEGYHRQCGEAHAEVNAIRSVADRSLLPGSTMYVSLEPCAHHGKTPPCADLIAESGIGHVHIACRDPFTQVDGKGIEKLRAAGLEVHTGLLELEAEELNRRFFTFHRKNRPYVILKWAETADGFVDRVRADASSPALKITGHAANVLVHRWRTEEAAIMVGKNTALLDNPRLTAREYNGPNPVRILLDPNLETPLESRLFDGSARTIVFTNEQPHAERADAGAEYILLNDTHDLAEVLSALHRMNMLSILVEGGPTLHRAFWQAGLWDEIRRFVSPAMIGEGIRALSLDIGPGQELNIGADRLLIYRN